jgi:hypothetical protein
LTTTTVNWNPLPTAIDNADGPIATPVPVTSPTSGLDSGDAFSVGTTTVTYTFTDSEANSSQCTFTVTVLSWDLDSDTDYLPDSWEIAEFGDLDELAWYDPDGDLLSNYAEYVAHTDPNVDNATMTDTDGDGMPDDYESANGLNPNSNDASGDLDGDGYTNYLEYLYGLDPQVDNGSDPDSDSDGLIDALEISIGTDLYDPDTDNDTFSDGVEFELGSDPRNAASVPFELTFSDPGLPGLERADSGSDSDNLVSGIPKINMLYTFEIAVTATQTPLSVEVYLTQRSTPSPGDFHSYDMTCTGDFTTGAICTYTTMLGPVATHRYYFEVTLADGTTLTYDNSGSPYTGPQVELLNGYTMVGAPRDLNGAFLDGTGAFGSASTYRWESFGLTTSSNTGDYDLVNSSAPPVDVGEGYFVERDTLPTLPELGSYNDITAPTYTVQLVSGWNLISNPFTGNVKLEDVKIQKGIDPAVDWTTAAANDWVTNAIYCYNGSDWGGTYWFESAGGSPDATLIPWMAYWVYLGVDDDNYSLIIEKP